MTNLKSVWYKYTNNETIKITSSSGIYKTNFIMVNIFCYIEKHNDKVIEIHEKNAFFL